MPHQLPPVEDATHSPRVQQRKLMQPIDTSDSQFQVVLDEFHTQVASLQDENNRLRMGASYAEQSFQAVMIENEQLRGKLDHLEQVFVNSKHDIHWNEPDDALFDENEKLKQDIHHLQAERDHLILQLKNQAPTSSRLFKLYCIPTNIHCSKPDDLRQENQQLQERLEHYQRREKELMKAIVRTFIHTHLFNSNCRPAAIAPNTNFQESIQLLYEFCQLCSEILTHSSEI